jgi:uncharacterized protein involved in cysteine biosynthesis
LKHVGYWIDFVTMPLLVVLLMPLSTYAALAVVGYVGWIFAEYYLHRTVFHRMYRREHWRHHRLPTDKSGAVSALHSHVIALATSVVFVSLLGLLIGGAIAAGLVLGYLQYIVLHHAIHHGWVSETNRVLGGVVRRHEMHHSGVEANFNFLIPLGDVLFGTYRKC